MTLTPPPCGRVRSAPGSGVSDRGWLHLPSRPVALDGGHLPPRQQPEGVVVWRLAHLQTLHHHSGTLHQGHQRQQVLNGGRRK